MGSWGDPPLGVRGAKTLIKRPSRVECTTFWVQLRLQTTAETAEPHTPECCSTPHPSPLASATGGSDPLDRGLHLPCCPPGPRYPSLQDADSSLARRAISWTCRLRPWDLGPLPPWIAVGGGRGGYVTLRLSECEEDTNVC